MSQSFISHKVERRRSPIHGYGIFATSLIKKDEVYAVKGGSIVSEDFLKQNLANLASAFLQIDDALFIGPVSESDHETSMVGVNHSCNPNGGKRGDIFGVAMKDILPDEEIVNDYAVFMSSGIEFTCSCGEDICRKIITPDDWKKRICKKSIEVISHNILK